MLIQTYDNRVLEQPITVLAGISAKRAELFQRLGITTTGELLTHLPRAYIDWTELTPIAELELGVPQTLCAEITQVGSIRRKGRLQWWQAEVSDETGTISITYFNQTWLRSQLKLGETYYFHGKVEARGFFKNLINPAQMSREEWTRQPLIPIYPATEGLSQGIIRKAITNLLESERLWTELIDPLPSEIRERYQLADLSFALDKIHRPRQPEDLELARRRIAFAELFYIGAAMKLLKERRIRQEHAPSMTLSPAAKAKFQTLIEQLPFRPTDDQVRAANEVFQDLKSEVPMSRLLQGDVGSGKTLVAVLAAYYAILAGYQVALLAPTSVLATQHATKISALLEPHKISTALLTGGLRTAERRAIYDGVASGKIQFVIGTHAVLNSELSFQRLGLVITDEQHRFGVKQRGQALEQSERPHSLVMSATPIPRTLGLILYGDLDISTLHEMPAGRQPIETYTISSPDLPRVYDLIRREVQAGQQAYIVCPLLAENEESEAEAATALYQELQREAFARFSLGLLHGRQKPEDKAAIIQRFLAGEIEILISTSVIEVGIDNPRASIMLIMNAERFGLAQLHQLRGRVGRGTAKSLCILHSDQPEGPSRERLRVICRERDGIKIAEADLAMRRPGQFFGERQHGLSEVQAAYAFADATLIREVETAIAESDLRQPKIRALIAARYPDLGHGETL